MMKTRQDFSHLFFILISINCQFLSNSLQIIGETFYYNLTFELLKIDANLQQILSFIIRICCSNFLRFSKEWNWRKNDFNENFDANWCKSLLNYCNKCLNLLKIWCFFLCNTLWSFAYNYCKFVV